MPPAMVCEAAVQLPPKADNPAFRRPLVTQMALFAKQIDSVRKAVAFIFVILLATFVQKS